MGVKVAKDAIDRGRTEDRAAAELSQVHRRTGLTGGS